jgi:hypothetical protein
MNDTQRPLDKFVGYLRLRDLWLTSRELAEALWLAERITPSPVKSPAPPPAEPRAEQPTPQPPEEKDVQHKPRQTPPEVLLPVIDPSLDVYVLGGSGGAPAGVPFRVPGAAALPQSLRIGRALRPLMKRVPSRHRQLLDEIATAERSAERGTVTPVLKPAPERWLDLSLVVDRGGAMRMWTKSVGEFTALLERHGAFRSVRSWDIVETRTTQEGATEPGPLMLRSSAAHEQRMHSPKELLDPCGRRLIAVMSDCVSPCWLDGRMTELLGHWGSSGPMVILQIFPRVLWRRSGLRAFPELSLRPTAPAEPNTSLQRLPWRRGARVPVGDGIPVPIVEVEAEALHEWARVVAAAGGASAHGVLFHGAGPQAELEQEENRLRSAKETTAIERVNRFDSVSGSHAKRLARLLAATPYQLTLPIMRLIQQTIMPDSDLTDAAEVYLGGLLVRRRAEVTDEDDPEHVAYDFIDGVRDLLLDAAGREDTTNVLRTVSRYVTNHLGQSIDFEAILADPDAIDRVKISGEQQPIAELGVQILRRMGGHYAQIADRLERRHRPGPADIHTLFPKWAEPAHPRRRRVTLAAFLGNDVARSMLGHEAPEVPSDLRAWSAGLSAWGLPVIARAAIEATVATLGTSADAGALRVVANNLRDSLVTRRGNPLQEEAGGDSSFAMTESVVAQALRIDERVASQTINLAIETILAAASVTNASAVREAVIRGLMREVLLETSVIPDAVPNGIPVWVLGTGTYELPEVVQWTAREVGRSLARSGHHLLVGAWPGVDHLVSEAFAGELEYLGYEVPPRLTQFVSPSETPSFVVGRVAPLITGSEPGEQARAAITIGGYEIVFNLVKNAPPHVKLLPLPWTGSVTAEKIAPYWRVNRRDLSFIDAAKVTARDDLGLPIRRLESVLLRESSDDRRAKWRSYDDAITSVNASSVVDPPLADAIRGTLPETADWLVHDYIIAMESTAGPPAAKGIADLAPIVATGARAEAYEVLSLLLRQHASPNGLRAPALMQATRALFGTVDEMEAWFVRFVGLTVEEIEFRWALDEESRELARSYLRNDQPLEVCERYAQMLRGRAGGIDVRRVQWLTPYLASTDASLRVIGYMLLEKHAERIGSAVLIDSLMRVELDHAVLTRETRPLWCLIVFCQIFFEGASQSERRIGARALRDALSRLRSAEELDPGGECKAFIRRLLSGALAAAVKANDVLDRHAGRYEHIRKTELSGAARTGHMEELFTQIRSFSRDLGVTPSEVRVVADRGTPGLRIVALAMAHSLAEPKASVAFVMEAIGRPQSPFEQFQALVLASLMISELSEGPLRALREAIEGQRNRGFISEADPSRWRLSNRLVTQIRSLLPESKQSVTVGVFGSDPTQTGLLLFCRELGEALARSELSVVTGAGEIGICIADAFSAVASDARRLQIVRRVNQKLKRQWKGIADVVTTPPTMREYREELVSRLSAAIAIGGRAGTAEECELAKQRRIPLIVLPATGGASAVYRRDSADSLLRLGVPEKLVANLDLPVDDPALLTAVLDVLHSLFSAPASGQQSTSTNEVP